MPSRTIWITVATTLSIAGGVVAFLWPRSPLPEFDVVAYCIRSAGIYFNTGPLAPRPEVLLSPAFIARNRAACEDQQREALAELSQASSTSFARCATAEVLNAGGIEPVTRCVKKEMSAEDFGRAKDFAAWSQGQSPVGPERLCRDYVMGAGKACREEMTQALAELRAIRPSPELMAMCLPSESQWRDTGDRIAIGMLYNCVVEQLGGERKHDGYATEHHP